MMSKQTRTVDLRNLGFMPPKEQPGIIKYKGKKVIGEDTIQTKKVYGFNLRTDKDKDKDKTPNKFNKTPTKFNKTPVKGNKTPTKTYGTTGSKLSISQQNTARKHPFTAKK